MTFNIAFQKKESVLYLVFTFLITQIFSYEKYEVYKEGEKLPFQIGRTDALGRVVFCPNEKGNWMVKTTSEDGHGASVRIKVEDVLVEEKSTLFERYQKIFIGGGIILGLFGILELYIKRVSWLKNSFNCSCL